MQDILQNLCTGIKCLHASFPQLLAISQCIFRDYYKSRESDKCKAKRPGPFIFVNLIDKNTLRLNAFRYIEIHLVIYVPQTMPYVERPKHISSAVDGRPAPLSTIDWEEYVAEQIFSHQKRGEDIVSHTDERWSS